VDSSQSDFCYWKSHSDGDTYITLSSFAMCVLAGKSNWFSFVPLEFRSVRSYSAVWECKSSCQCPWSVTRFDDKIPWLWTMSTCRAIAQAVSLRRPWFEPRSGHVGFVVDKVALNRFSPSITVSPANSHSTDCSTLITIIRGWYNRPNSGRHTKWTQSTPTPETKKIKRLSNSHFVYSVMIYLYWIPLES
jgi:hypothetical protein